MALALGCAGLEGTATAAKPAPQLSFTASPSSVSAGAAPSWLDLDTGLPSTVRFSGSAAATLTGAGWGLVHVPALDAFLARGPGGGGTLYRIDASTLAVDALPTSGGVAIPPTVNGIGVYTRLLAVPALQGVLYVPTYTGNAWFLRTH